MHSTEIYCPWSQNFCSSEYSWLMAFKVWDFLCHYFQLSSVWRVHNFITSDESWSESTGPCVFYGIFWRETLCELLTCLCSWMQVMVASIRAQVSVVLISWADYGCNMRLQPPEIPVRKLRTPAFYTTNISNRLRLSTKQTSQPGVSAI